MSTLVLALTAVMAVPASGPASESGETEQALDLRGNWRGTWVYAESGYYDVAFNGTKFLIGTNDENEVVFIDSSALVDEGRGKCHGAWYSSESGWVRGIYQQDQDRLMLCFRDGRQPRPRSFRARDGQHLIILRRVKAGK